MHGKNAAAKENSRPAFRILVIIKGITRNALLPCGKIATLSEVPSA